MLNTLKNNRSLTFYQPVSISVDNPLSPVSASSFAAAAMADNAFTTATTTTGYNTQLENYLNILNAQRDKIAAKVAQGLANDPSYTGARGDGVSLAWKYEKADIMMGGSGSENWSPEEQQEIKDNISIDGDNTRGGVRGAEGHHQKNVADHPEDQGDPDNIKFYRSRKEHLEQGHDGDWSNESDAPKTDKNAMLEKTNSKRVFKNELRGIGIAAAIGIGVGFTIGFAVTLAQSGITPDSVKAAFVNGAKGGAESGVLSVIGYGVGRTIGETAVAAVTGLLGNIGIEVTENISKLCSMGVVGTMMVAVFSVYQFAKLKLKGVTTHDALVQVGKQALFSLSLLAVSIVVQGVCGGCAGIIVSTSVGIICVVYSLGTAVHQRHFSEKLQIYMIDKCKPAFA